MEKAKLTMNLKVAGKPYRVNTRPEKEEIYRLAEQEVNDYINSFRKGNYIALAALHLAISNVQMRQTREVGNEDLKALDELNRNLDAYLNEVAIEQVQKK